MKYFKKTYPRIALKLAFAVSLIVILILFPVSEVDFVYTGF